MKTIMVMFDSLNRHMLSPYGCDWIKTPNFERLIQKTVRFTNAFVGSMPCMPARRELHTGRYNFLHRSWGPLEPFDDSMPEILKKQGIYSHLISDHYHYWEDGGCTYHTRYNSWEISRGQEGDPWKGNLTDNIEIPPFLKNNHVSPSMRRQDWVNRHYIRKMDKYPQSQTFLKGFDFITTNHLEDNWFLTIETFDPHEPFFSHQKYKELYPHNYNGLHFDWPGYDYVTQDEQTMQHVRNEYAALVSMCDENIGKLLDLMDKYDLWKDTMLIVNTDHGFLLGEHNSWAKCWIPFYNEIAHIPLFIWDPHVGVKNKTCDCLVQTIDLPPTILDFFNVQIPEDMQGKALKDTIQSGKKIRDAALFGIHGGHVNCTDGRYIYMRAPAKPSNSPLYEYTLMPTHMRERFSTPELNDISLSQPFEFTKGYRTMKIKGTPWYDFYKYGTLLFDCKNDPRQIGPIHNPEIEQKMLNCMITLMKENDTPVEQYERIGINNAV
ncbi:MAG: sulfatase [Phycisphaerales bacterium]